MSGTVYNSRISKLRICIFLIFILISGTIFQCSKQSTDLKIIPYTPPRLTNTTWEQIEDPESAGWSTEKLQEAYSYSQTTEAAAVMIIYNGKVLYYWGDIKRKFFCHSCRKSFMSALYGIHVHNGNIDLDRTMGELGIDDKPPSLSDIEKTATVRMLLKARSGIYHEAAGESQGMKERRPDRYSHEPGTFWYYNNWDFNALGTIFEQETGTKIFHEFYDKIAKPTGMEDFNTADCGYHFQDVSGNPIDSLYRTAEFCGTSLSDTMPPQLTSVVPQPGDKLVTLDQTIQLYFDEPLDTLRFPKGFVLSDTMDHSILGQFCWPVPGKMVFKPDEPFLSRTRYQIQLSGDEIKDLTGNKLVDTLYTFQTINQDTLSQISGAVLDSCVNAK